MSLPNHPNVVPTRQVYGLPFGSSKARSVSFSGYPGRIAGIDDFYVTSQQLTVIETTNGVYNTSLATTTMHVVDVRRRVQDVQFALG